MTAVYLLPSSSKVMELADYYTAEQAKELYLHRRPLYQKTADITIDIREKTFEQVAAEAGSLLWERGLL